MEKAKACCADAAPVSADAPGDNPYSSCQTYMKVNASAMYRFGGNGSWGQLVRGCLMCALKNGAPMHEAHKYCYKRAAERVGYVRTTTGGPTRRDGCSLLHSTASDLSESKRCHNGVLERQMNLTSVRRMLKRAIELLAIVCYFFCLGAGIGLWQGHASGIDETTAALVGGPCAVVTGRLLYFFVLKQKLSFEDSAWIGAGAAVVGVLSALLLRSISDGDGGWFSVFVTPVAAFVIALVRSRIEVKL
jgi:hypothetical protein